jgi:hypothetical protein
MRPACNRAIIPQLFNKMTYNSNIGAPIVYKFTIVSSIRYCFLCRPGNEYGNLEGNPINNGYVVLK